MEKTIAIIWDCDNTLVDGYMQNPIFDHFKVNPGQLWKDVFSIAAKDPSVKYDSETTYLNYYLRGIENGTFPGMNNALLREIGSKVSYFPGVPTILRQLREEAAKYGAKLENYLVFTGFAESVKGSALMPELDGYWGCELAEGPGPDGTPVLKETSYTLDNLTKARVLYEVHEGIDSHDPGKKRDGVAYENMVYVADGPGDEHVLRAIKAVGGCSMTVWSDPSPFGGRGPNSRESAQALCDQGLSQVCCKADYTPDGEAGQWLLAKVRELAQA